jgi:hypothetical protein
MSALRAGAVAGLCAFAWAVAGRGRANRWGATDDEVSRPLLGDELSERAPFTATRAISIAAGRDRVWPWIAQIGQGRGGFYSYARLENLIGCRIENADRIHPEWQTIEPGDEIRMHPHAPPLTVLDVRPDELLLVGTPGIFTWAFALEHISIDETRLLVRSRGTFGLPHALGWLLEPGQFVMERRMLLGIRERAERNAGPRQSDRPDD